MHTPQRRLSAAAIAVAALAWGGASFAISPGAAADEVTRAPTASQMQGSDYGNPADKKAPTREEVQRDANAPTPRVLDDNAQRAHDPSQAATPSTSGEPTAGTTRDGQLGDRSGSDQPTTNPSGGDTLQKTQ